MTNAEIILHGSIELMKNGVIKSTGRLLTFEKPDGTKESIPEPEPLHTFAAWKDRGRQVKKGQHAKAAFSIWKCTTKTETMEGKNDAGENVKIDYEDKNMFLKKSFFFTLDQTEAI